MIAAAVEAFGKLDVIFNNAGISQACHFMEVTEKDWHRIMDVNGLGVLIGTQEAARQMKAQGAGGKIIDTASIAAKQGYPLFAHYCASKFAVAALTQAAARALAVDKITVNAFAHGVTPAGALAFWATYWVMAGVTVRICKRSLASFSTRKGVACARFSTCKRSLSDSIFLF